MTTTVKALLASYARSVLAAASALFLAGVTDPLDLLWSLLAALLPVAIRYVNPNDPAFGRVPTKADVDAALKAAKPKKAPVKKTTTKKTGTGSGGAGTKKPV
jgi:hypothetical protein